MPARTIELSIKDGDEVLYSSWARVNDDFAEQLFDAYKAYYPDAQGDENLFYQLAQGVFTGIQDSVKTVLQSRPPKPDLDEDKSDGW